MRQKMFKWAMGVIAGLALIAALLILLLRDQASEMMREANQLRNEGRTIEAANLFGKITLLFPEHQYSDQALFERGFTYYVIAYPKANENDKGTMVKLAQRAFEKMIDKYPDSEFVVEARLYLGELFTELGENTKALENYEAAEIMIKDLQRQQDIRYQMALNYEMLGQYDRAVTKLKQIINQDVAGRSLENAYLTLARYYRVATAEDVELLIQHNQSIVQLMYQLLDKESEISEATRQEALLTLANSLMELKLFDESERILNRVQVTMTNRDLLNDYRDRLNRFRTMGNGK